MLTDAGAEQAERLLREDGLLTEGRAVRHRQYRLVHHTNQALRAHKLFARDVDYIVKDDKVIIIDKSALKSAFSGANAIGIGFGATKRAWRTTFGRPSWRKSIVRSATVSPS